jgi:hypothetical protein
MFKSKPDQKGAEARRTDEISNTDAMAATFVFRLRIRTG